MAEREETETISREDFYKLEGLLALAREHNAAIDTIVRATAQITGEPDDGCGYFGFANDAVSEGYRAAELLRKVGIEVEEATDAT